MSEKSASSTLSSADPPYRPILLPELTDIKKQARKARKAAGAKQCLALVRRFKALDQQRQDRVDSRRKLRVSPVIGMCGMMEAVGRVENRLRRRLDVCDLEHALLHTVGEDPCHLV